MANLHATAIILNPASGQGDPKQRHQEVVKAAAKAGWQGKVIQTTPDKLATYAANQEWQKGIRHFVVCGGDGTIIEAIEALVNKQSTIGIVPLGTGNLLAKNLGIPLNLEQAMQVALHGHKKDIDIGQANHTFFAIMAGMGVDARIMRQTSRRLKNVFGLAAYYWVGLKRIGDNPTRFLVQTDNQVHQVEAKTILVANMGKFAGNLEAVPHAKADDGSLKIGIIKARTWTQLLDMAKAAIFGNIHQSRYYSLLEGKRIVITPLGQPQPYQCDGNDYPPTNSLTITIHPQAISVMVPQDGNL